MALIDMVSMEDLIYAAAFIDADGCVSVSQSYTAKQGYPTFRISVQVGQKLPDIPMWFHTTFGGSVRIINPSQSSPLKRFIQMNTWALYCNKAADFLELVEPYLKMKRRRAQLAIRLARACTKRGGIGFRYGGKMLTLEEAAEREQLAILIRQENMKTSARCAPLKARLQ